MSMLDNRLRVSPSSILMWMAFYNTAGSSARQYGFLVYHVRACSQAR
jgi:hypothetical protein